MGRALDVLKNWAADNDEAAQVFSRTPSLLIRWLNEAQLRFCDKSEVLSGVWEPDLDSDGIAMLPEDFLREYTNRVKWTNFVPLVKGDYPSLVLSNLSTTRAYAIFDGRFWVFAPSSGTPKIPYIKKPDTLFEKSISGMDLSIPSEMGDTLTLCLDAYWARKKGDTVKYLQLLEIFDRKATESGVKDFLRKNPTPTTINGSL